MILCRLIDSRRTAANIPKDSEICSIKILPLTLTAKEKQKQLVRIEKFLLKSLPDGQLDSEGRVT